MDTLSPIIRCSCASNICTCGILVKLDQCEHLIKLSQFLMGLNEQFITSRGQIMLINPLPDLSYAYAMVSQKENQRYTTSQVPLISEKQL